MGSAHRRESYLGIATLFSASRVHFATEGCAQMRASQIGVDEDRHLPRTREPENFFSPTGIDEERDFMRLKIGARMVQCEPGANGPGGVVERSDHQADHYRDLARFTKGRSARRQLVRRNVRVKRPFERRQDTGLRQTATVHRLSGHDLTVVVKVHELAGSLSSAVDV